MSAFVLDREEILYLTNAAVRRNGFSWYHDGQSHQLQYGDVTEMIRVTNMLWQENIKSVMYRYEDCTLDNLPGRTGENYVIDERDLSLLWETFKPVEILKSCACYEYQACEHEGWRTSEAYAFINSLRHAAIYLLPGYEEAPWGAPKPLPRTVIRLV